MNIHLPTIAEIEGAKTAAGGWTRRQLAEWGVTWPPPKRWKAKLVSAAAPEKVPLPKDGPVLDHDLRIMTGPYRTDTPPPSSD